MSRHVSTENLARFRAGDLSPARSGRIAAHLRKCARCRETSDALAQVPSLLASVEVPPMPAHLAARIETALAAESARRIAVAPDRPARHAGARRRPRRPVLSPPALRVLAAAGAAVVLVGGGVELLSHVAGPGSSSGVNGAGGTGHRAAAASPDLGQRHSFSGQKLAGPSYPENGRVTSITPVHSGTDYQSARLTQQVNRVLAAASTGSRGSAAPAVPDETPAAPAAGRALDGCVSRIAAGAKVLLVDVSRFDRKPATIIVTARPGRAQVWVVGPGCSATASDVLAHQPLPGH
jgi:hypothetical protein